MRSYTFRLRNHMRKVISLGGLTLTALFSSQMAEARTFCPSLPEIDQVVCLKSPDHRPGDIFLRDEEGDLVQQDWADFTEAYLVTFDYHCRLALVANPESGEQGWVSREVVSERSACLPFSDDPTDDSSNEEPNGSSDEDDTRDEPISPAPIPNPDIGGDAAEYLNDAPRQDIEGCAGTSDCERKLQSYAKKNKKTYGYGRAREIMFQNMHVEQDEQGRRVVKGVYTGETFRIPSRGVPDHNKINCEHTMPRSRLKRVANYSESQTDLNHLFPTNSQVNSTRSSLPFADCDGGGQTWRVCNRGFEPPHSHKGTVARAIFYMSLVYNIRLDSYEEDTLRRWSKQFPVTDEEARRASLVFKYQGNRNPFIDNADWVDLVEDF